MKFITLDSSIRNRIDKKTIDRIILDCLESIFDNGVCMDCTKYSSIFVRTFPQMTSTKTLVVKTVLFTVKLLDYK